MWKWLATEMIRDWWWSVLIICGVGAVVYSNTLGASWHYDDYEALVNNPAIRNVGSFIQSFEWDDKRYVGYITFAVNWAMSGTQVWSYHVFNICIHLTTSALVWWLVMLVLSTPRMKQAGISRGKEWIALIAGLWFVVHPVQIQAVTYIVQRFASLATLFYVFAVGSYLKLRLRWMSVSTKTTADWLAITGWGVVGVSAFFLGLYTKVIIYSFPVMLIVVELWCFRVSRKRVAAALGLLPILAAMGWWFAIKYMSLRYVMSTKLSPMLEPIDQRTYLLTQMRVVLKYIQLIVVPLRQNIDYYFPVSRSVLEPGVLLGIAVLAGLIGLSLRYAKRYPEVGLGVWWFLLGLSVESSVFPLKDVIYEHRLYLPMVGASLAVGGWVWRKWGKNKNTLLVVLVSGLLVYGGLAYRRNATWQTELSLWSDAVVKSPRKARVQNQVAVHWQRAGDLNRAIYHYQKVLEVEPGHADVHYNLGQAMMSLGEYDEAIEYFLKAVELNPEIQRAYNFVGEAQIKLGRYEEALVNVDRAIEAEPGLAKAYKNRGDALLLLSREKEARVAYQQALELDPGLRQVRRVLLEMGE